MTEYIFRDYQLKGDVLFKNNMDSGHLLYRNPYRGTPAIDAIHVWNIYKDQIDMIEFWVHFRKGGKAKFLIDKETFDRKKKEIIYGNYGIQYAVPKQYWRIEYEEMPVLQTLPTQRQLPL